MRTVIFAMVLTLVLLFSVNTGYSALKDFKDDYRKEESTKSKRSVSGSSGDDAIGECLGDCLFSVFSDMLVPLWVMANYALEYAPYPYNAKEKSHFICRYNLNDNNSSEQNIHEIDQSDGSRHSGSKKAQSEISDSGSGIAKGGCFDGKTWYITIEGGGQYAFNNGNAGFGRLSGKIFRFFGPEIEAKRIVDEYKNHLDFYAFGINIPIAQFSGFSPELYIQRALLRGIVRRDGVAYGLIINSYPVRPLSLMVRFGAQSYDNIRGEEYSDVKFYDYEGRIGVIFNRFELFAGYRHLGAEFAEIKGPVAGIKIFL